MVTDTYHPRLTEILEQEQSEATPAEAEQEGTQPTDTVEVPAQDAEAVAQSNDTGAEGQPDSQGEPVQEGQPESQGDSGDDFYVRLDKRNAYAELAKLDQDPYWREHLRTFGGRKAKREYEGRVSLLEKELEAVRKEAEHLRFQAELSKTLIEQGEEAVQERLRTDPEFARRYHQRPEPVDLSQEQESIQLNNHIQDLLEWGMQQGIPPQRIRQFEDALHKGLFDHPVGANGQPDTSRTLTPVQSISMLQAALNDDAQRFRMAMQAQRQATKAPSRPPSPPWQQGQAQQAPESPAPKPNPALVNQGPDLSGSGPAKAGGEKISMEEYRKLTPPEKLERWPTKGLQELIDEGVVEPAT